MDKESMARVGLANINRIDYDSSDEIYDPSTNNHIIKVRLLKDDQISCPFCGVVNDFKVRGSKTQIIHHSTALENDIIIKLYRRVYSCECGHTFKEDNPFNSLKRKNTIQREFKILQSLKDINKSFSDVANEFNMSTTSVINVFDAKVDIKRQSMPTVLCVDEVYSKHCGFHRFCFVTYSPQQDKILDVLPSRNKEDLCGYFGKIPIEERNKVKYFSMDLYETYRQVAHLCFPNALVCADHFHVMKNINECFNQARIRIMKRYQNLKGQNDNWYWLYKKYWKILLKAKEKLGYKKFRVNRAGMFLDENQIRDYMLNIDPELKDAYELLNEYRNFNQVATIDNAAEMLDDLIIKFHNSTIEEYSKAYNLLKRWRNEIINSFHRINGHVISNGGMERANRDIKTIIRHAYGYTNFQRLRNRIMYVKNDDAPILGNRKKKENKN